MGIMEADICASMRVMKGLIFVPDWKQWCNLQRVLGRMEGGVGEWRGEWSLLDVLSTNGKVLMTLVMAGH